ncbi:MAG TPA: DUF1858 domain-containing protein [Ferrovibrio sp.]|jgi:hybrid cluster-associated redox disulfide protein|uniref:DUF1858 domain-containing protein n=1 Tax=Ferrovibrio sp. TaxID=1917215 RepID=UPI002ED5628D
MAISEDWTVEEVMRRWPGTIRVFLDFRLRCVGCPIACFHSIADACREHQVDQEAFLAALRRSISPADPRTGPPPA